MLLLHIGGMTKRSWIVTLAILLGSSSFADAAVQLQKVKVVNPNQIDLSFDAAVDADQVQIDYINDIIQLTFKDTSVYPAKITSVNGGDILKVFAYQYSPQVVRTRFTVKGRAADYEGAFRLRGSGKTLSLRMGQKVSESKKESESDSIALSSKRSVSASDETRESNAKHGGVTGSTTDFLAEEKKLFERVVSASEGVKSSGAQASDSQQKQGSEAVGQQKKSGKVALSSQSTKLGEADKSKEISLQGYFLKVILLIGSMALFLVGSLFVFKAISKKKSGVEIANHKGFASLLKTLGGLGVGLGGNSKKKIIEVIANHHLGPKRSLAVVKIGHRHLVLGVTPDSINLITDLGKNVDEDVISDLVGKAVFQSGGSVSKTAAPRRNSVANPVSDDFSDVMEDLAQQSVTSSSPVSGAGVYSQQRSVQPRNPATSPFASENARARIRSKLEGLKPL